MSVFISYSHRDADFVNQLSIALVGRGVKVWKDQWQINVGDSLLDKIEQGIINATYLIIVISKHSIKSPMVNKELKAALMREIEDNAITILPIKIDDAPVPLFLREKLYADFREDFDGAFQKILNAVADKYNLDGGGRVAEDTTYYFDFAFQKVIIHGVPRIDIDIVSFDTEESFSILTQFHIIEIEPLNKESFTAEQIISACAREFSDNPARVKLLPANPYLVLLPSPIHHPASIGK